MDKIISANNNDFYKADENPRNILNNVSHLGAVPINQHYVFFKNGGASIMQNEKKITPEIKLALEKERNSRKKNRLGPGSIRPIGFTERQMTDLYYNSYGLDINIVSRPYTVDPFMIALVFGGYTSLIGLLASIGIALSLQVSVDEIFSSSIIAKVPRMGVADYYSYEKKLSKDKNISEIVSRLFPQVSEDELNKLFKTELVNLSSREEFKKNIGNGKYDTMLSKYHFNGGSGFKSSSFSGVTQQNIVKFIENLKSNFNKKKEPLNVLFQELYAGSGGGLTNFFKEEEAILDEFKVQKNSILKPISVHIDFSDYTTLVMSSVQKGYPNPAKEKSIFGPYICRSKKAFLYYPKIIVQNKTMSTLSDMQNGISHIGALDFFGVPTEAYNIAFPSNAGDMELILRMASFNILPTLFGGVKFMSKDSKLDLSGFPEDMKKYDSHISIQGKLIC
jgi:hypothetical protein